MGGLCILSKFLHRQFIRRAFEVIILDNIGSLLRSLVAGMILGLVESSIAIFFGSG